MTGAEKLERLAGLRAHIALARMELIEANLDLRKWLDELSGPTPIGTSSAAAKWALELHHVRTAREFSLDAESKCGRTLDWINQLEREAES